QVTTLKALNLRHCPLEFPPHLIVQKGLVAILTFLRICSVENAFPGGVSRVKMNRSDLPCTVQVHPQKGLSNEKGLNVSSHEAAMEKGKEKKEKEKEEEEEKEKKEKEEEEADIFLPMDWLDLSELHRSSIYSENWPSEEEIRRFWKLRQEIVENEKVDFLEKKLLAVELPPNLRAALNAKEKKRRKPGPSGRKKSTSFKGILPSLPSTYQNTARSKRLDDIHMAALRELKEKETMLEQRRRDKRVLQEWREKTQMMRNRREFNRFQPPLKNMMASKIPFATDLIDDREMPVNPFWKLKHSRERTTQSSAEMSASPLADLEEKIRRHTQKIRARNFLGTNPLQDMKMANQDLETAKKLQEELRKLKLEMTLNREHSFATFPGNLSLHPPASQPQNIFFNTKY
ncbi:leucine-rich repeat-containing protein 27, partial [Cricetulus griseus]